MDLVGHCLGNYRVVRLLGEGGAAQVYLGEHQMLTMQAAIKVLHPRYSLFQQDIARFLREARTIAHLEHPHIVRVLECALDERGLPYLVMEYAPGGTLRQWLPEGTPLALPLIEDYVQQLAQALQYAHDQHVIHRDVKPENVLMSAQGHLLLSDFGLALLTHSSSRLPMQDLAGSVAYLAPEQMQGHPRRASDQYALGVMVYEWLTGRTPFTGSVAEVIAQHLSAPVPSPRALEPSISPAVEAVVLRALAKDPKARFPSVQAFAEAFAAACPPSDGTSRTPRPVSRPVTAKGDIQQPSALPAAQPAQAKRMAFGWVRSHRWPLSAGLAALVLVLALGGGLLWQGQSTPFKQAVVTGKYVTSIQVGEGVDPSTGAPIVVSDTFYAGKTVGLVCHMVGWRGAAQVRLFQRTIFGETLVASQQWHFSAPPFHNLPNIFTASATLLQAGRYRWEVEVPSGGAESNGRPDASITFQVINR
jgi:tRNA A-37 threonylcarbamoyl transferase component Bud32